MNLIINQRKYGQAKAANFIVNQRNHGIKNKIYKYMTSLSINVHIDKLDEELVNTIIHIIEQPK